MRPIDTLLAAVLLLGLYPPALQAQTPLESLRLTSDITVVLDGTVVHPNQVAEDDLAGGVSLVNVGSIPANAMITAYDLLDDGDQLLAFDIDLSLPGPLVVRAGDVVRFDGTAFALLFDATANGIPRGVTTDAVAAIGPSDLLLSFDVTVNLPTFVATDADVVRFHDGAFSLFFASAAAGVASGLDLDALHCIRSNGNLLLSFDGSGAIGEVVFDDEDVLEYAPASGAFALAYDGQSEHAGWFGADLQAVDASTAESAAVPPMVGPTASGGPESNTVVPGSTRVSGRGTPRAKDGDTCIAIYDVGPNHRRDAPPGSVDDILLGVGGTDAMGNFVAADGTLGIPVSPPLSNRQLIFAADVCSQLDGAVRSVLVPAPALSPWAVATAVLVLATVGAIALRRQPSS